MARILVIDDDPDISALLEKTLTSAGHEVALAGDGGEGVEQFRTKPPDLVIAQKSNSEKRTVEAILNCLAQLAYQNAKMSSLCRVSASSLSWIKKPGWHGIPKLVRKFKSPPKRC